MPACATTALAVGHQRHAQIVPLARELEAVVGVPGRRRRIRLAAAARGDAGALARKQAVHAARGGGVVERLRHGAELGEMRVDEAGVEFAGAELRRRGRAPRGKPTLLRGPATTVRSSAVGQPVERLRRASAPCAITLAIIGS